MPVVTACDLPKNETNNNKNQQNIIATSVTFRGNPHSNLKMSCDNQSMLLLLMMSFIS